MDCPKCQTKLKRKKRPKELPKRETYYFTEWDFCEKCGYIKHYEKFKKFVKLENKDD